MEGDFHAPPITYTARELAERLATIRQELLAAIEEEAWTYVPSRGERLSVLSATAMRERLDRIIPEEG